MSAFRDPRTDSEPSSTKQFRKQGNQASPLCKIPPKAQRRTACDLPVVKRANLDNLAIVVMRTQLRQRIRFPTVPGALAVSLEVSIMNRSEYLNPLPQVVHSLRIRLGVTTVFDSLLCLTYYDSESEEIRQARS